MKPISDTSKSLKTDTSRLVDPFSWHLSQNESIVRQKYRDAFAKMKTVTLSGWFYDFVDTEIVPLFFDLGIEPELTWALFKMAAPSWQSMKPSLVKGIWFDHFYVRVIKNIKRHLERKAAREQRHTRTRKDDISRFMASTNKQDLESDELDDLIDDVSLSWIILPRAYGLLEKRNARELSGYLRYLRQERDHEFRRLITHILIEYVGNFALKYMSRSLDEHRMLTVLFYGYATMFWKSLRSPPEGLENDCVHNIYLNWAKNFMNRVKGIDDAMEETVHRMVTDLETVFAPSNAFGLSTASKNRPMALCVALRHGEIGLTTAVNYFGFTSSILKDRSAGGLSVYNALGELSGMLTVLKRIFPGETKATQQNITSFLSLLRGNYARLKKSGFTDLKWTHGNLSFRERRLERMVEKTRKEVSQNAAISPPISGDR